ncbi:hypothetical protein BU15DRAFT_83326 [Melanogaster broomeanus]|nr:hypothetical protein BU15DRAFT_83326 [Melanogaster broomeanus]
MSARVGTPVMDTITSAPLRSSQITQRARNSQSRQLSRTFSVHDINALPVLQQYVPPPPSYDSREDGDGDTEPENDDFLFQCASCAEPGIDEISPDEDDRAAEAVLRLPGKALNSWAGQAEPQIDPALLDHAEQRPDAGDVMGARHRPNGLSHASIQIDPTLLDHMEQHPDADDVIAAYHQRNGKPRVPDPEQLREIRNQQKERVGVIQDSTTAHERSGNLNPKPQGTPVPSMVPTAVTSDGTLTGHATKFCSYPHRFHKVIERAKLIAQCECATKDPFPARSTFLDQSSAEIINEALLECENVPPGYWPNYRKELGVLLWESLMMWHSTLKGKAHEVVTQLYNIGKHHTAAENQAEAETLIKGAVFLRDGVDDEGSTNNMAHPALATLVMEFFYGPASLGTVFPEVFSCEVPRVAVCLVATALRAALDEYIQTSTRQDRPFKYSGYSKVFTGLLDLQRQIDTHEKHAAKTKLLRVAWAQGSAPPKSGTVIPFSDEFVVVLD